jgi:hypothetical protein
MLDGATAVRVAEMPDRLQLNMRLDPRTAALLVRLRRHLNLSAAAIIRLALIRLARAEGVEVPDDGE